MATADVGAKIRIPVGDRWLYLGTYTAESGDTSVAITVKAKKIDFFYAEGMTKYSVSGSAYTVTITDPAATVTRNYWYVGR
jgi:hypothetical protein